MNLFGRKKFITNEKNVLAGVNAPQMSSQYTLPGLLSRSSYDNGFAPISAISDEILKRNVHLGDVNNPENDVTQQYSFWNAITRPNDRMGFMQFVDLLVAGFLSLSELSFLVWHTTSDIPEPGMPEGGFTIDNIAGFTVLSNDTKSFDSQGCEQWYVDFGVGNGQKKFSRDDVITLKYSLLPDDGLTGVSPGSASAQEAAIRDRLNQYERAMFDNGATPSLIVTIFARSHAESVAMQESFERANRGASKAQGVVYQTVIDNGMLQGMAEPRIEVNVVGTHNNSLAISEIVDMTQTTITSNYGVSPIIYGDATTTTFQNQNLADNKFMGRVQSVLVRLFATFENEISRITNMLLPFTFVWDDVELDIAEEQEIKARINTERTKAFLALVQSGVPSAQAAEVLELEDSWKGIVLALPETPAPILNVKPLQQLALDACTCEHHENKLERVSELEQSAQKKILNILKKIARELFEGQVFNAASNTLDQELIDQLTSVMQQGYETTGSQFSNDLEQSLADFGALSQQSISRLEKRASKIITNYVDFVTEKINGLPDDDPAKKVFTNFYAKYGESRASLIAQQETKNAYQHGEYDVAKNVDGWLKKNKPQSYITKIWTTTSDVPCKFCKKMNGTEAGIKDSFVPGSLIDAEDTVLFLDPSYTDGTIPDAHANCQCVFKFKLVSK